MTIPKILIVDDEPFNVDYLEQELEELDYQGLRALILGLKAYSRQRAAIVPA